MKHSKDFSAKKITFLPVETEVRELDYKIMLAGAIAEEGTACFVGQHNLLNNLVSNFNGGVYLGKNIFPQWFPCHTKYYDALKSQDFSLLYYHEEGGIWIGAEEHWRGMCAKQIDASILHSDDQILCWGEFQKSFYESLLPSPEVHNVGVARFDLAENMNLRKLINATSRVSEDDYILINTNFAAVNHCLDFLGWFKPLNIDSRSLKDRTETMLWYSTTFQVMGYFLEMLTKLVDDFPTQKFILRPHPTESIEFYEEFFKSSNNIIITKEFSAPEWIDKCTLLIQNACTTAIEAHMMNKKVISFYPVKAEEYVNIVSDIGYHATTYEEVRTIVQSISTLPVDIKDSYKLSPLVKNFNTPESSIDKLAERAHESLLSKPANKINLSQIKRQAFFYRAILSFKELPKYFLPKKKKNIDMFQSHFPGFQQSEIEQKVKTMNKILDKNCKLEHISKDLFVIYS
jgi:surface carbohydrate biosynthesis protein